MSKATLLAGAGVPRGEYPQPQFERDAWVPLNGAWEFEFDDANEGLAGRWYSSGRPLSRKILVPFCFESPESGIGDPSRHPVCWYRRTVRIPEEWSGRRVLLRFGAVDYRTRVWVNGLCAGGHEGGQTPFSFDITDLLEPGGNILILRVEDPPDDRTIPRGKQFWKDKPEAIWYTRTSGIWQSVWMEPVGASHLESVRITASHDGKVAFEPVVGQFQPGLRFSARVLYDGAVIWEGSTTLRDRSGKLATFVDDCRPWSPQNPELYDVEFELEKNGAVLDSVFSYFGFRSVSLRDGVFYLNNSPTQLRMILDQGYWPETLLTPPSDEAIQTDIRAAKEMGFNGVRKHQKVEDPRFLYWADRFGLLVSGEIGNAYAFSAEAVGRLSREWEEAVQRDYNHPCVVMWVPVNESWGVPDLSDSRQRHLLRAMYGLTKSLDDTRLVIDNDGWEHTESTDLFAVHDYTPLGEQLAAKYAGGPSALPEIARPPLVEGATYNGAPLYMSEFGGVAYATLRGPVPEGSWGYYGVEKDYLAALQRIQGLLREAGRLKGCVGFCYTQLTDVEQEINGLLTYSRVPKFDPREIRAAMEQAHEPEAAMAAVTSAVTAA